MSPVSAVVPDLHRYSRAQAERAQGAEHHNPTAFRFIEAMARRTAAVKGDARRVLESRLADLRTTMADQGVAFEAQWGQALPGLVQRHPRSADALCKLHAAADARALQKLVARLDALPHRDRVGDLVRHIAVQSQTSVPGDESAGDRSGWNARPAGELKAVQRHQDVWARLRVEQQLVRSHRGAPANPGPLNSHFLVLRSLRRMQEIAPAYLTQFVSHAETLLWLEQASHGGVRVATAGVRGKIDRKKTPRVRG